MSKPSVIDGLRRAVEHGLLIEEVDDRDLARIEKFYALRMKPPEHDDELEVKNLYTDQRKTP